MRKRILGLLIVLAALPWAHSASAVIATLVADSYTVSTATTTNKGKATTLLISGPPDSTKVQTTFVQFDLSTLPGAVTDADISKATLAVFVNSVSASGSFDVVRVTSPWTESTISAAGTPTLGLVEQSAVAVALTDKNQFKVIDVTNVVKAWRNGSLTNDGLALVANAVDGLNAKLDSKESTAHSQVPRLEITLSSSAGGGVTNVSAASPLSVTNPTTTPNITLGTVPIASGGTNATTTAAARGNLGAAASGANSDITVLSSLTTPLSLAQGGTNATTAAAGRANLSAAASGANGDITSLTGLTTALTIPEGGTGANTAVAARTNLAAAASGANSDITALSGLTTALPIAEGGTGAINASNGRANLGAAASGANLDITSLLGITDANLNTKVGSRALESISTGGSNTAMGESALFSNTTGATNTAMGLGALTSNITGSSNTATGYYALGENVIGVDNTAVGHEALVVNLSDGNTALGFESLQFNSSGHGNTGTGRETLNANTSGSNNTAVGIDAMHSNTNGSANIAVGLNAGFALTTGDNNIEIGNFGNAGETNTIRIGDGGTQTRAFIAGIRGVTTGVANGIAVLVDSQGQLGTVSSSRRFKTDIRDMGSASSALMRLRPVTFKYKPELDPSGTTQYGLIAEEVEQVLPDLVARDKDGNIETVKYHLLSALLLNEVQKQQRAQAGLQHANDQLARDNAVLRTRLENVEQVVQRLAQATGTKPVHVAAR